MYKQILEKLDLNIRLAKLSEVDVLTDLSIRSKSYWGYDKEFISDAIEDLTLNPNHINNKMVYLCELNEKVIGYYALADKPEPEMIALFVDPNFIGKGIGYKLWNHSLRIVSEMGWNKFKIIADPFAAEKFYLKVGCQKVGDYQSPIRINRKIPILVYELK